MGLFLKVKPKQRTNWKIFFKHALEMYNTDQFIGVPFGKGGYGYVGNPFSRVILEHLHKYSGFSEEFRPILLVKSANFSNVLVSLPFLGSGDKFLGIDLMVGDWDDDVKY